MQTCRHTHAAIGAPAVSQVADALDTFCVEERLPQESAWRLRVALDEIVANIVSHGSTRGETALDVWFRRDGPVVEKGQTIAVKASQAHAGHGACRSCRTAAMATPPSAIPRRRRR